MKGLIEGQFNEEQLVLAKATAQRIESNIQTAITI